jgi:hypothetical protein
MKTRNDQRADEQVLAWEKEDIAQNPPPTTNTTSSACTRRRGGPRTKVGKTRSRLNAVSHGLTATGLTELDDYDEFTSLVQRLMEEKSPVGDLEKFLVHRIAFHILRLQRAGRLEAEFIRGELHPPLKERPFDRVGEVVVEPGLPPAIGALGAANLVTTYQRYETALENKLYRAVHELERQQRTRRGEYVHPPQTMDLSIHSEPANVDSSDRPPEE